MLTHWLRILDRCGCGLVVKRGDRIKRVLALIGKSELLLNVLILNLSTVSNHLFELLLQIQLNLSTIVLLVLESSIEVKPLLLKLLIE